jgi:hypothetical protein
MIGLPTTVTLLLNSDFSSGGLIKPVPTRFSLNSISLDKKGYKIILNAMIDNTF